MEGTTPGEAAIDRYVVLEYLAEGGMGAIYLGKKMGAGGFEKQVVLKQLLPEFTRQPEFIDLFLREARLSATLDHANIIHTIDLVTAGEDYFIVMEYLDGADLRTLLRRCKKKQRGLSPAAGIYVARELLSALAYAHNKVGPDGVPLRLIHRDISPSNILISGSGEVKLTDFGIAKASTHNSVFYRVKGKVGYMSPEQAKSEHLDARSDLYSLAVCLFEIITGERLFVNVGLTTSADEMYAQPVPLVSHKRAGLPPELDKVMLKALSRDPDHRYQTAGEFQEALLRCAHKHGLMMSAPDLAEHLRQACGDSTTWRDEDSESASAMGTELYEMDDEEGEADLEPEGTEQIGPGEVLMGGRGPKDESDADMRVALASGGQLLQARDGRRRRARTSITKLTELRNMELTSMINLAGGTSADHAGSRPLIDFNDLAQSPMLPSTTGDADPGAPGGPPAAYPPQAAPQPHPGMQGMHGMHGGPHAPSGPHPQALARSMPSMPPSRGGPPPQALGKGHPLAQPGTHVQQPRGSLAHIDPLEQTGIVVEPGDPGLAPQGPPHPVGPGPMHGPPPGQAVPTFMPPGMSASMPIGGPPGAAAYAHTWSAALAPAQRPWLLLTIIVLLGIGTATIIGMSGPTVEASSSPVPLPTAPVATAPPSAPTAPTKSAGSEATAPKAEAPKKGAP